MQEQSSPDAYEYAICTAASGSLPAEGCFLFFSTISGYVGHFKRGGFSMTQFSSTFDPTDWSSVCIELESTIVAC